MQATGTVLLPEKSTSPRREHRRQWRQEQINAGLIDPVTGDFVPRHPDWLLHPLKTVLGLTAFALLLILAAGQLVFRDPLWGHHVPWMSRQFWMPHQPRPLTVAELAQFDGTTPDKPVYLSIKGDVYDVSHKRYLYGPGGGYSFFAGRDASRAFVTGCFHEHLTHDVRGFSARDLDTLDRWHAFFEGNDNYMKIGYLVDLPEIDPASPIPTGFCMAQPSR